MIPGAVGIGGTVEVDLGEVGIVVLDSEGRVTSTNARARELLRADSQPALSERVGELQRAFVSTQARQNESMEAPVDAGIVGIVDHWDLG